MIYCSKKSFKHLTIELFQRGLTKLNNPIFEYMDNFHVTVCLSAQVCYTGLAVDMPANIVLKF